MFSVKQKKIYSAIPKIFFATSFLVVTVFQNLGLAIVFFLFLLILLSKNKVRLFKEDIYVILLFYLGIFASFAFTSFLLIFMIGVSYVEFYPQMLGRMMNITIYLVIFLFIIDEKNNGNISTEVMLKTYLIGCYILLAFGIWQTLHMLFQIPYPGFTTRDHIHSMDEDTILPFINIRITSIAREPAFLVPYLVDAIIILFYTSKKYLPILISVVILFFTLSLSGYVNIFLIIMLFVIFSKKTKGSIFAGCVILLCGIYIIYILQGTFLALFLRLELDYLLLSTRGQEAVLPLKYMFSEASWFNILFGFGPRGMSYVTNYIFYTSGWLQGQNLAPGSHVIFVNFFMEHGIIGLLMITSLFAYLFLLSSRAYKKSGSRLGQVLCLNLVITSLYTSDYASPRFTGIIILLLCLYKDTKNIQKNITLKKHMREETIQQSKLICTMS